MEPRQRQLLRRLHIHYLAIRAHLVALRVNPHAWRRIVPLHIFLTHGTASADGLGAFAESVGSNFSVRQRHGGHEREGIESGSGGLRAPHWTAVDGLNGWDGCVCVTHLREQRVTNEFIKQNSFCSYLRPGDRTSFNDDFGFRTEVFRSPKDKIGEFISRN